MQVIFRVAAANGVKNIWVPQHGIMSTPAVSAAIRNLSLGGYKAQGAIVLTASHNPGGPGQDFGIKYNEGFGQPAGESFTDAVSETWLKQTKGCLLFYYYTPSQSRLCYDSPPADIQGKP
jgi:phosphoglucomutase